MVTSGYSGTPLAQKLGLKDGQRVLWVGFAVLIALALLMTVGKSVARERTADEVEIKLTLIGCWGVLSTEEIAGQQRTADAEANVLCFDSHNNLSTRHVAQGRSAMVDGAGRYSFADERLVLEFGSSAGINAEWALPNESLNCDVHVRSGQYEEAFVILSGCRTGAAARDDLDNIVLRWPVAVEDAGQNMEPVWDASDLQGCWHSKTTLISSTDTTVNWRSYCFDGKAEMVENSGWSRSNPSDGEGREEEWSYSIQNDRLVMVHQYFEDMSMDCVAHIEVKSLLALYCNDERYDVFVRFADE